MIVLDITEYIQSFDSKVSGTLSMNTKMIKGKRVEEGELIWRIGKKE